MYLKKVGGKVVMMEPIFSMNRGFKVMLMSSTIAYGLGMARTRITSSITKVVLTITPLECLLVTLTEIQEEKHLKYPWCVYIYIQTHKVTQYTYIYINYIQPRYMSISADKI